MSKGDDNGLTINEAAEQLDVSPRTVRRWIQAGKLTAAKVPGPYGPEWRIPVEAVSTAQQVVDVVRVERPTDPATLALAVAQALEQRDRRLIDEFSRQLDELRAQLNEQAAAQEEARRRHDEERDRRLMEAIREAQAQQRRPWWRFWR